MSNRPTKWHHRLFGTIDQRRRLRDVALRRLGLARSRIPMELVRLGNLAAPNVVRGMAADVLLQRGELNFVQVGAFDGRSDDDLTTLLPLGNVHGVLVEPQPEPFAELGSRYANQSHLHLVNAAIASEAGEREFYRPRSGASRLASFDRANLLRHGVPAADIVSQLVRCLPLEDVLAEARFNRLDVLQIDAEGYDLEVLGTIDLDRWQPSVIRFEFLHSAPRELDKCLADMTRRGYRFLVQHRDIVATRPMIMHQAA